jgi:hypothetical protein
LRKDQLILGVLEAAKLIRSTDFVIIGSQAVHGTFPDPPVDAVARSIDVDLFPIDYRESMFVPMHAELGFESEFFDKHGFYVEIVRPVLPRFPAGWRERATTQVAGIIEIAGEQREVRIIFPEIHDLAASKLAIGRDQDKDFIRGIVALGLVQRDILEQRIREAPRTSLERIEEALQDIDAAFSSIPP